MVRPEVSFSRGSREAFISIVGGDYEVGTRAIVLPATVVKEQDAHIDINGEKKGLTQALHINYRVMIMAQKIKLTAKVATVHCIILCNVNK